MNKPTPDARQKWNQFFRTGHPADYLAYSKSLGRARGPKPPQA